MFGIFNTISKLILVDRVSFKFVVGVLFGLGFSISVILCTVGIMDGFKVTLKQGLKKSAADLIVHSQYWFL